MKLAKVLNVTTDWLSGMDEFHIGTEVQSIKQARVAELKQQLKVLRGA